MGDDFHFNLKLWPVTVYVFYSGYSKVLFLSVGTIRNLACLSTPDMNIAGLLFEEWLAPVTNNTLEARCAIIFGKTVA